MLPARPVIAVLLEVRQDYKTKLARKITTRTRQYELVKVLALVDTHQLLEPLFVVGIVDGYMPLDFLLLEEPK